MDVKNEIKSVNWEKITVYLTITIAFLTIVSQLFQIKDEIKNQCERIAKLEVKVEKLEENKK